MIKKIRNAIFLCSLFALYSCAETVKNDYVTISAEIPENSKFPMQISGDDGYYKIFDTKERTVIKDTLKVRKGMYYLMYEGMYNSIYLENGYDLTLSVEPPNKGIKDRFVFSGFGADENNFLSKEHDETFSQNFKILDLNLDEETYKGKLDSIVNSLQSRLGNAKGLSSDFVVSKQRDIEAFKEQQLEGYKKNHYINTVLAVGEKSPVFDNYRNHAGGTTSLADFKGKYVYIDLWATWCKPCKAEIPHLEKLSKEYKGKNIEFVSISTDYKKDWPKWEAMVKENHMEGIQLLADNDFKSDFVHAYRVDGIPRFIIIDPEGNIVNHNAPRPSYRDQLLPILETLDI